MSEQNSTDRTDQTDEPQTTGTGTDHGPGNRLRHRTQGRSDRSVGRTYVGRRGRSLEHRPGD